MGQVQKLFGLPIFIFCVMFSLHAVADESRPTLYMVTGEWEPYVSETLPNHGGVAELVVAIVNEMGMDLKYEFVPWVRAESLVKRGDVFGAFPYASNEQRRKDFDFSDPLFASYTVFFYYKPYHPKLDFQSLEELKDYRIAGVKGYFYIDLLEQAGLSASQVNNREQLVLWLYRNRVDLVPMDLVGGQDLIRKMLPDDTSHFTFIPRNLDTRTDGSYSHILISRKFPRAKQLTAEFNAALERVKEKKIYQQIMLKNNLLLSKPVD